MRAGRFYRRLIRPDPAFLSVLPGSFQKQKGKTIVKKVALKSPCKKNKD
jgi:hypothetical protein